MKKRNILNLIKHYVDRNDAGFRTEAYAIAKDFDDSGDSQLAAYIMSMLSNNNTLRPQVADISSSFLRKHTAGDDMLLLPDALTKDVLGIVHAIKHGIGINKFLFQGAPGTGKTIAAKKLSKILSRDLYEVNTSLIVDSKLGQTQKNIQMLFDTINSYAYPDKLIVLFDEIDALALDRTDQNDLREMGRATSTLLKGMDELNKGIILVATTNLYARFDKALARRFDFIVDFNRYTEEDLLKIAERMLDEYLTKTKSTRDIKLFRKILKLAQRIPLPGDLQNLIKTAIAFSDPEDGSDYFRRLYSAVRDGEQPEMAQLQSLGFTVREIGILTKVSKSGVSRKLQEVK